MKIFDPYIESRALGADDLRNLHYFGTEEVIVVASPRRHETVRELMEETEFLLHEEVRRLGRAGIKARVAVGVSPANMPRRRFPEYFEELPELLRRPEVAALGAVGVWEDRDEQWELFEHQVKVALEVGEVPIVVTPPRELKRTFTYKMLGRLEQWGYPPEQVAVANVDKALLANVLESGVCAIVPVGNGDRSPREIGRWIRAGLEIETARERIMLTGALRATGADVLAILKTVDGLTGAGLSDEEIRALVCANGERFFSGGG